MFSHTVKNHFESRLLDNAVYKHANVQNFSICFLFYKMKWFSASSNSGLSIQTVTYRP